MNWLSLQHCESPPVRLASQFEAIKEGRTASHGAEIRWSCATSGPAEW